jgi:TRAP-type C4-dicarboxylate transport system permease small subunit
MERLSLVLNRWIEYLLFSLGLTMTFVVALQVFFRYVLNQSLFWSEELARFLLVWLSFLGASVAYRRKAHPGIDVLSSRMPDRVSRIFTIVVHVVSIAFFSVMIFYGYRFAYFVRLQISPALYVPKWVIFSIVPLSGLILMIHGVTFLLQELERGSRDY